MNVLFILAIIAGSVTAISLIVAPIIDEPGLAVVGLVTFFIGFVLAMAGSSVHDSQYDRETVQLCDEKGGIVSKDNHCFVDGRPVEFSPGVWER